MKTVSNQLKAMLFLGFLAFVTKAKNCTSPPVPADQAWIDTITASGCTVVNGDLHLGKDCTMGMPCPGASPPLAGPVNLAAVQKITGRLTIYGTALTSVGTGTLQTIEGALEISDNAALTSVGTSALQTVGGGVIISDNYMLTSVDFSALQTVSYFQFYDYKDSLAIKVSGCFDSSALEDLTAAGVKLVDDGCSVTRSESAATAGTLTAGSLVGASSALLCFCLLPSLLWA